MIILICRTSKISENRECHNAVAGKAPENQECHNVAAGKAPDVLIEQAGLLVE